MVGNTVIKIHSPHCSLGIPIEGASEGPTCLPTAVTVLENWGIHLLHHHHPRPLSRAGRRGYQGKMKKGWC